MENTDNNNNETMYTIIRCKKCNTKVAELKTNEIKAIKDDTIRLLINNCLNITLGHKSMIVHENQVLQKHIYCSVCDSRIGLYCAAVSSNKLEFTNMVMFIRNMINEENIPESKIIPQEEFSLTKYTEVNKDLYKEYKKGINIAINSVKYISEKYTEKLYEVIENNNKIKAAEDILKKYFEEIYKKHNQEYINKYNEFIEQRANSNINTIKTNPQNDEKIQNLKKKNK